MLGLFITFNYRSLLAVLTLSEQFASTEQPSASFSDDLSTLRKYLGS